MLVCVNLFLVGKAQIVPEHFVHCFGSDTLLIEKISESVIGDTVIKEFRDHVFDPGGSFKYYFYSDSVFIKYDNEFYMIGDNNAEVGDVWHPIRFNLTSYTDTTESCPFLMNLEVIAVDTILIDGMPTAYFSLKDQDWWTATGADHKFLSGIGVTTSGPFYNLAQQMACNVFVEYSLTFKSYRQGDFVYTESTCVTSVNDLNTSAEISVFPNPTGGHIYLRFNGNTRIDLSRIYDSFGKLVLEDKTTELYLDVSEFEAGIYFLELSSGNERLVRKFIKTN